METRKDAVILWVPRRRTINFYQMLQISHLFAAFLVKIDSSPSRIFGVYSNHHKCDPLIKWVTLVMV